MKQVEILTKEYDLSKISRFQIVYVSGLPVSEFDGQGYGQWASPNCAFNRLYNDWRETVAYKKSKKMSPPESFTVFMELTWENGYRWEGTVTVSDSPGHFCPKGCTVGRYLLQNAAKIKIEPRGLEFEDEPVEWHSPRSLEDAIALQSETFMWN